MRWSESQGAGKHRRTIIFSGHEIYFKTNPINLTGGYPNHGNIPIDYLYLFFSIRCMNFLIQIIIILI